MFTVLLLCLLTPIAHSSVLLERKLFDPFIVCHNPPPPSHTYPDGYSERDYRTTMELCSAANGRRDKNMGCFCSSATSMLDCDAALANPALAAATGTAAPYWYWGETEGNLGILGDYCNTACYCEDEVIARSARGRINRDAGLDRVLDNHHSRPHDHHTRPQLSNPSDAASNRATPFTKQCGNTCWSNADCAGKANGCTCKTQSEQYVPGKGTTTFVAACIISLGGKREEQIPCPCNSTYVSNACCSASDGVVQEPEHFRLGELRLAET